MTHEKISNKYKDNVNVLRNWLKMQPHLPQNIDNQNLLRFLSSCNNSVELAKKLLDNCFTLRSQIPEIFDNRSPERDAVKKAFATADYVPLPKLTSKNYKVFIYRLRDSNPDNFIYADVMKAFFMVADLRMCIDYAESEGEVPIFDMAGYSLRHLTKINLSLLRKYMTYSQEAHPVRIREIHLVNTPPFLDKCLTLIRPFLKSEVSRVIHYHTPNSTTLYDFIPRDLLPEDYGGTLEKTSSLSLVWRNKVMDNRDFYLDDSRWKVDESKRPAGNCSIKGTCGLEGSFRSLNID